MNRLDFRDAMPEKLFFFVGDASCFCVSNTFAVEFSDIFYHDPTGEAPHAIEEILGEIHVVAGESFTPGDVMQRHGVSECAVAVEDESCKIVAIHLFTVFEKVYAQNLGDDIDSFN